jgi:hypothetical protein
MIDSTHVRADRSAAGGKGGRKSRLWITKRDAFTTLAQPQTALQIVLTPADLGFTDRPTIAEMLDAQRLAARGPANLADWVVALNPAEAGPPADAEYREAVVAYRRRGW